MHIKIGTRGSKLALWQAYYIQELLEKQGATSEIIIINTKGDKILDRALSKIGSKGVFTEELEEQLLNGEIDIAVHSAKDLQSDLGEKLSIIAFTEREKTSDVLVSNNKNIDFNKKSNITIGTSSTRRVAMLKSKYPQINIVDMRGNLQSRIKKMEAGACDALMLAYAGVHRMELLDYIIHDFDINIFTPPVGQGCVAIETANNLNIEKRTFVRNACNNNESEHCLLVERAFLKKLQGGCSIPVFGNAIIENDQIIFTAGIISLDGNKSVIKSLTADLGDSGNLGIKMAEEILANGGKEILDKIKSELN